MSAEDHAFDERLNRLLRTGGPIDLAHVEPGAWTTVCGVGEARPRGLLPTALVREGEMAMDHVFDSANTMFGPSSALVFVDETGAEVRPLSRLHISNVNFSLYGCVLRSQAVIVRNGEGGWRYRDRPEAF